MVAPTPPATGVESPPLNPPKPLCHTNPPLRGGLRGVIRNNTENMVFTPPERGVLNPPTDFPGNSKNSLKRKDRDPNQIKSQICQPMDFLRNHTISPSFMGALTMAGMPPGAPSLNPQSRGGQNHGWRTPWHTPWHSPPLCTPHQRGATEGGMGVTEGGLWRGAWRGVPHP